jgi:deazaflavin-dependent oxidoreductase (nitroreductase family)
MSKAANSTPAVGAQTVRTLPRFAILIFWLLHRALHRFSGGRIGLSRPEAGARFGMLRLRTLGRRSGEARAAIIGYYEDGPNLVTLAMNGWGRAEPAWWLNLQANPDATVDLADGPRAVRARAASGDERDGYLRSSSGDGRRPARGSSSSAVEGPCLGSAAQDWCGA